ncbi:hypothetical protein JCM5296_005472 [Sporobolomyces johnsonii]
MLSHLPDKIVLWIIELSIRTVRFDMSCLIGHNDLDFLLYRLNLTATKSFLLPRLDRLRLSYCSAEQDTQHQTLSLTTRPTIHHVAVFGEIPNRGQTSNHPYPFKSFPPLTLFFCDEEDSERGDTDSDEEGGTDETWEADAAEIETGGEQER